MRVLYLGPGQSPIVRGRIVPFLGSVVARLVTTEPPPAGFLARNPTLRCTVLPRPALRHFPRRLFLHTLDYLTELPRLVRRWRPDLIHVHYVSQLDAIALLSVRNVPIMLTVMGADVLEEQIPRPLPQDLAVRALFRRAAAVTAKSEFLADRCRRLGAPPERIHLVPWGVDQTLFHPLDRDRARSRLALPTHETLLVSSRALDPLYNHLELLDALHRLDPAQCPAGHRPRLVLSRNAQEPTYARRVEDKALALGLEVTFLEALPAPAMPLLYAAADACVSIPASDGLPQTLLEALACGRPVLSLDLPAYHELPFASDAMIRVAHTAGKPDPDGLVEGLRALLDAGERAGLALARAWIEEHADFAASVDQIQKLYHSIAG